MDVIDLPLEQIIPYARNPRRNAQAIATVAASIQEFGWRQPIVVDEAMVVLAGHTRLEANVFTLPNSRSTTPPR
jgi:ParB-like chromosome segregation protein Spo0J